MIDAALRELVHQRAGNRCEYCLIKQEYLSFSTFQVEHIIPRKHGGDKWGLGNKFVLGFGCRVSSLGLGRDSLW